MISFVWLGILGSLLTGVASCIHQKAVEHQTSTNQDIAVESTFQMNRKYPYANDRMVYIPLENGELEQWSVDGVYQQKIRLSIEDGKNDRDQGNENGKYDHVYSTPIERKDGKEVLLIEQTKELFVCDEDSGIGGAGLDGVEYKPGICVNDSYIIYQSAYEGLFSYNRKQGGKPVQLTDAEENQFQARMWSDLSSQISGDRIVCHSGIQDGKIKDDQYGFWNYSLSDRQVKRLTEDVLPGRLMWQIQSGIRHIIKLQTIRVFGNTTSRPGNVRN